MKGQFFLLGALLLIILFFVGFPLAVPKITEPSNDLPQLADNILREYPAAFNFGINTSSETQILRNFTFFVNETLADRGIHTKIFWVYTRNVTNGTQADAGTLYGGELRPLNLTVGNFMGENVSVNITILSTDRNGYIPHNQTGEISYQLVTAFYNMSMNFSSFQTSTEWVRDKENLYVFLELERGQSRVRKELSA